MNLETVPFEGHDAVRIEDGRDRLVVTVSVGPRILGFGRDGANVMAVLPDLAIDRPGGGRFPFVGGHRLWAAPEVPEISYRDADGPCVATEVAGGVRIEAPPDAVGLAKAMTVRSSDAGWTIDHEIRNASERPMTIAAWAITQLRPGGTATLPLPPSGRGPQADRALVLWPYTDPSDERIVFERDAVRVRSTRAGPPLKIGSAPGRGTISYRIDGHVFEKRIGLDPEAPYTDRGAALQVYVHERFCELETLGPLGILRPGERVHHRERWSLRPDAGQEGPP